MKNVAITGIKRQREYIACMGGKLFGTLDNCYFEGEMVLFNNPNCDEYAHLYMELNDTAVVKNVVVNMKRVEILGATYKVELKVDWFAIQFPKLLKTFRELGV